MLQKLIRYKDLDKNWIEEIFWFNINLDEAWILETEYKEGGSFMAEFERVIEVGDKAGIGKIYRTLIKASFGRRLPGDNIRFPKEDENGRPYYKDFMQTDAYLRLLVELMDVVNFKKFMDEVFDPEYIELMQASADKNTTLLAELEAKKAERKIDEIPESELLAMSKDEFWKLAGSKGDRNKRTVMIATKRKLADNERVGMIGA